MADDPTEDRSQYDESVDISTERDRVPKENKPCKHGKDPRDCEDTECLIEWHHEHDAWDLGIDRRHPSRR
jgi:hypothetical protein